MRAIALLLLLFVGHASVQAGEDLLSLYRDALESDARFASARAQYAAVETRVPQSRATLLPALSFSANTVANRNDSNRFHRQSYGSHGFYLNLTQPLFRWENWVSYDQSKLLVEQSRAELELARQDLVLRLSQAYFDVLFADDSLATRQAEQIAIGEQLASANRRYELGSATITDVRDAKARFDLVAAQVIAARNEQASRREVLRQITNRYPDRLAPLLASVELPDPDPADMERWVDSAVIDNLAVVAGQAALAIARLETRKARAGHYPTIDLTASIGESRSGTINTVGTDLDEERVGLQLSMPIYSGGAVVGRHRETLRLLEKAQADLDNARRASALTARQTYLSTTAGLAQVAALEEALASARIALQANQRGLELGARANIDVLNAQQQLSATERDLTESRYDTLMSMLRLKAAAGRLGDTDIESLDGLFER